METLARQFDQPLDSPEYRDLAENGWVGGEFVTIRYWLGRLVHRNLFRESDAAVKTALRDYFIHRRCEKGASLVDDIQTWSPIAKLLRHHSELATKTRPTQNPRLLAALDAVMANPGLANKELAALANTTEKQIARMPDVFVIQKIWRLRTTPTTSR